MAKFEEIIKREKEAHTLQTVAAAEPPGLEETDPFEDNGYEQMTGKDWQRHAAAFGVEINLTADQKKFTIKGDKDSSTVKMLIRERERVLAALQADAGAKSGPDLVTLFDETFNEGQPSWLEVEG